VTAGVNYGLGFSFCANSAASGNCGSGTSAVAPQATRENADTTLVTSPTATVCSACHDSDQAQAHMSQNGGSLYLTRALGLQKEETCLLCHGSGKLADIKAVHAR
jgi:hypothetical protein